MSKESREEKVAISLGELVARANQLRDYLTILSSQIDTYTSHINELQVTLNTLKNIPDEDVEGLIVLDRLNSAFIPVSISGGWLKTVIVNIGRNYYMKTDREKAVEIINKRLEALRRILNNLRNQYQNMLNEYNTIQQILASIYSQQVQKSSGTQGS
ncbi:MAG: prefoldin subunit alpha [Desulfurococcales archaeon ex4484_58]|nr:MAG: prefoldin subunit alpha [Desulfurococcales archaeon ex4484_58]